MHRAVRNRLKLFYDDCTACSVDKRYSIKTQISCAPFYVRIIDSSMACGKKENHE